VKVYEYQARELLAAAGIPVPAAEVAEDPEQAVECAGRLGCPVVIKAQVLVGGRGKAGGVKVAEDPQAVRRLAGQILSLTIKGVRVQRLLVARALQIRKEYYLGLTVDRGARKVVCIASASGGVEIEELARTQPQAILRAHIDPLAGPDEGGLRQLLARAFPAALVGQALSTVNALYRLLREKDCSLVEINPYALTGAGTGDLVAADAKIVFDDNGLMKHPEIEAMRSSEEYSPEEIEAREAGLSFVGLEGEIGCMVNGAGLAMATMDLIKLLGGRPANFLDVGGSSSPQKVLTALRILTRNRRLRAILINIFGGITRCDDIARGILIARQQIELAVPLVIRLIGTNQSEGQRLLREAGLEATESMTGAVRLVLTKAGSAPREG
jgi:succinyl-CoA synthetase beta subunit